MLDREEYVEQVHLFRAMGERMVSNMPLQELLASVREELLASTRLPMAIDFMLGELRHSGVIGTAMERLGHYFSPFQTYVIHAAEQDEGGFDMRVALKILEREAQYRADQGTRQGLFLFQLEAVCRNRLRYDPALKAMADDPAYDADWHEWILTVRRQIGLVDMADLIYVRSAHYRAASPADPAVPVPVALFGEKEGRIAVSNRQKDPLYLFGALQRHLGYPSVPRPAPIDENPQLIPQLLRRIERMEARMKFMEDEQRKGSIDLPSFYSPPPATP
ncbi:MAG: hypothetical protein O2931_15875 [Planctomycetota bacterium]|nr:hypothetical protein [Planctomycetota bacterium]MDA1180261.1 hypothetical protein [Planctomycetota bacterium]